MTIVLNDGLKSRGLSVHTKALLLGSFMPDVPLLLLTLGFLARRSWLGLSAAADPICGPRFNHLYFHHPLWQAGHNLFHAPLLIGLTAWVGYRSGRVRQQKWGLALVWFALACGFHSLVDIVTHSTDGPLLFFPLNWNTRFPAPVSYWDANHAGKKFALFERLLALALGLYFGANWILARRSLKGKESS